VVHSVMSLLVLLVDDLEDNRAMYAEYLVQSGYRVVQAADGRQAVVVAQELLPDLVVMDLSLPVLDGCAAIRQLRADDQTASIPVIALTGHAAVGDVQRARAAGCDAFLVKPCLPSALLALIRELTSGSVNPPP